MSSTQPRAEERRSASLAQLVARRSGHQRTYAALMAVCALVGVVLLAFAITRGVSFSFDLGTLVVLCCGLVGTAVFSTLAALGFMEAGVRMLLDDSARVVWIYERHIRSGHAKQLSICLADARGVRWDLPVSAPLEQQPQLFEELRERFPSAKFGYTTERAAAYAKDPVLVSRRRSARSQLN